MRRGGEVGDGGGVGDSVGGYITQAKTGTKGTPLSIPFKQYFMKT